MKMKTEKAEGFLRKLLKENGFDWKNPDLKIGWETFKRMDSQAFDCSEDELLFETGIYDDRGEELYYLSIVRQFTIDVDGEYDYIEQLYLEFTYRPDETLKALETVIWSYDFDGDSNKFFKAVEKSPAFFIPQKMLPVKAEVYLEEV